MVIMRYLGGKTRIGKEISDILKKLGPNDKVRGYLEPFCGSLGDFRHMSSMGYKRYYASDIQSDLIELWQEVLTKRFKFPRKIDKKRYYQIKNMQGTNSLKAYVGFGLSFGGKYFGGYITKEEGDYNKETKNSIMRVFKNIDEKRTKFKCCSYSKWKPKDLLIYCDPPYKQTTGYSTGFFNHDQFWNTMREWSKHNIVIISEYSAPKDFKCIWKKDVRISIDNLKTSQKKKNIEKLFTLRKKRA